MGPGLAPMARPGFGVRRPIFATDIDGAWLIVVIRPHEESPEPTARHVDTYKAPASALPEDPALVGKLATDLRELADELDARGWAEAFRNG
jgi:hypothetical protein